MDETTQADIPAAPAAAPEPSQEESHVDKELAAVGGKKRSKLETLEYTKKRVDAQIAEERKAMGLEPEEDDRPVTFKDLKELKVQEATDTAIGLTEAIEDPKLAELTRFHIENTIRPSGDPHTDFVNAKLIVEAVKNGQKAQELARIVAPRSAGSAPSAPPKEPSAKPELSKEQREFARQMHMTEEEAFAAIQSEQA